MKMIIALMLFVGIVNANLFTSQADAFDAQGRCQEAGNVNYKSDGFFGGDERRLLQDDESEEDETTIAPTTPAQTTAAALHAWKVSIGTNEQGDPIYPAWTDDNCGKWVGPKYAKYCTGHREEDGHKHGNGRCTWNRGGNATAMGLSIAVFAGWMLILLGLAVKCNCCCNGWLHRICCICLHLTVGEKEVELQRKYLDNEPDVRPGQKLWSFWNIYKSTDPYLGTFFCEPSHYSNRFTKGITVLFMMTYGLMVEYFLTVGRMGFEVKFFVVTIPNALLWNPLMDKYTMKVAIKQVRGESEGCLHCFDKFKNLFILFLSCVFFGVLMGFLSGGGIPLPNDYIGGYFLNSIVFPIVTNGIKEFLFFSIAWGMVQNGDTKETASCWKYSLLSWTGSLPGSISGNITQKTPDVEKGECKRDASNNGAGGSVKIEVVEQSDDSTKNSHQLVTE